MTPIERRKKEVELARVKTARMELELMIEEKTLEIEKLKQHVNIQIQKEREIEKQLK